MLVGAHHSIMHHHQAATTLKELFKPSPFLAGDIHSIGRKYDEHIGILELIGRGKSHGAIRSYAALPEELLPFLQKTGMVMLIWPVCLHPGADEGPQWSLGRAKRQGAQK